MRGLEGVNYRTQRARGCVHYLYSASSGPFVGCRVRDAVSLVVRKCIRLMDLISKRDHTFGKGRIATRFIRHELMIPEEV